MYNTEL